MIDESLQQRLLAHAGRAVAAVYRPVPSFQEEHGIGWWRAVSGAKAPEQNWHNWLCLVSEEGIEGFLDGVSRTRAAGLPALVYVASTVADQVRPALLAIGLTESHLVPAYVCDLASRPMPPPDPRWRIARVESTGDFAKAMTVFFDAFDDDPAMTKPCLLPGMLDDPSLELLTASDDAGLASAVITHRADDLHYVVMMGTRPDRQRQGAGAAVLAESIRRSREHGARWSHLIATSAGEHLYRKIGYELHERGALWMLPGPDAG